MNLGTKIRRMRQVRGLTVVALATYARVTPGFISQLEYSQTCRPYKRSNASPLRWMCRCCISSSTTAGSRRSGGNGSASSCMRGRMGRACGSSRRCPPSTSKWRCWNSRAGPCPWSTVRAHEGQQCHVILQGTIRADYADQTYHLDEGDSILWDATTPYRLENIGDTDVRILIAIAPASLWKQGEAAVGRGTAIALSQWERAEMQDGAVCNAPEGLAASANGQGTEAAPSSTHR